MAPLTRILTADDGLADLAPAWDALAASRGAQADLYDSHAWAAAWLAVAPAADRAAFRLAAVFDGERPVAMLPAIARGRHWSAAGLGFRPRVRPIVAGEAPDPADLDALVGALAAGGARTLELPALPLRDPATAMLAEALRRERFAVRTTPGSSECLAPAAPTWTEHARGFQKFDRTVKNFSNKAARLGAVTLDAWGPADGAAAWDAAFALYTDLHGAGWKGTIADTTRRHRRELLQRAAARGWARAFLLRVAGVPAAAILWFRVGGSAIAYSTVYDDRLAALSTGTVVMWRAHERIYAEGPAPALFDYLPGRGAQKDQLGPERPGLETLVAERLPLVAVAWRRALRPLARIAAAARRRRAPQALPAAAGGARTIECPDRGAAWPAAPLTLDPDAELYLAVAGGHGSAQKMTAGWSDGDAWWCVGAPALALARLGRDAGLPVVREIVRLPGCTAGIEEIAGALAAAAGETLTAAVPDASAATGRPLALHDALLPWTGAGAA